MTKHFNRTVDAEKRRSLRRRQTVAEHRLWQRLRSSQLGVKFRRQYSVDGYVLDFYAPARKLVIEVDGDSHFTPQAIEYDAERSQHLRQYGIAVVRVTNRDVIENIEGVLTSILERIAPRTAN